MPVLEDGLSRTFAALADPTRRAMLGRLTKGDATVNELAEPFTITQQAISRHVKVLEQAGLVSRRRVAQSRPCHLEADRLDIAQSWISEHRQMGGALRPPRSAPRDAAGEAGNEGTIGMTELAELTYRRAHRASREMVFECMTRPEHLTKFWGPEGTTTPLDGITVDLRPGGAFETRMVNDADGSEYTMRAVYLDVAPPERLVWQEATSGIVTTITFDDLGDGTTEVVTHQAKVPARFRTPEARAGFATSLDRFDAYLSTATPGS